MLIAEIIGVPVLVMSIFEKIVRVKCSDEVGIKCAVNELKSAAGTPNNPKTIFVEEMRGLRMVTNWARSFHD